MSCNKKVLAALVGSFMATAAAQLHAEPSAAMLANTCAGCHGTNGASAGPASPSLAGASSVYFVDSMKAFKSGERKATIMDRIAKGYSDAQYQAMGDYFAKMPIHKAKQDMDAGLVAKGKGIYDKGCQKCHDENGTLASDDSGILAGQWLPYMSFQMDDFIGDHREMPKKMRKQVEKLSADDVHAVLQYFASQQ